MHTRGCLRRPEGSDSLKLELQAVVVTWPGCWELNVGLLHEQYSFLIAGPSLQPGFQNISLLDGDWLTDGSMNHFKPRHEGSPRGWTSGRGL